MDLTIVALTFSGLWQQAALDSPIGSSLSEQSLWYCVGTLLCNIPAVLLPGLNLNGEAIQRQPIWMPKSADRAAIVVVMNVIGSMPGTTFRYVFNFAVFHTLAADLCGLAVLLCPLVSFFRSNQRKIVKRTSRGFPDCGQVSPSMV